jgi:thiol-disulfide isomerase/thioredoxin
MNTLLNRRTFASSLLAAGSAITLGCITEEPINPAGGEASPNLFVYRQMPPLVADGWLNGALTEQDLRGHVQVVDCFASWCGPCAAEAPALVQLYLKYRYNGVRFWGMTREGEAKIDAVMQFVQRHSTNWPIAYGAGPMLQFLEVSLIPRVFVVGKDGVIRWDSQQRAGSLERAIRDAMLEPDPYAEAAAVQKS